MFQQVPPPCLIVRAQEQDGVCPTFYIEHVAKLPEGKEGLLACLFPLNSRCVVGSTCPAPFSPHLSARTRSPINLFRLKERIDRGPAISSVCHRRSLGLLNPYLSVFRVPMMPSVLPRSLRTVTRTAAATSHALWPLGWMPIAWTPSHARAFNVAVA